MMKGRNKTQYRTGKLNKQVICLCVPFPLNFKKFKVKHQNLFYFLHSKNEATVPQLLVTSLNKWMNE